MQIMPMMIEIKMAIMVERVKKIKMMRKAMVRPMFKISQNMIYFLMFLLMP